MKNDSNRTLYPNYIEVWWAYDDGRRERLSIVGFDEAAVRPGAQIHFQNIAGGLGEHIGSGDGGPVLLVVSATGDYIDVDWSQSVVTCNDAPS